MLAFSNTHTQCVIGYLEAAAATATTIQTEKIYDYSDFYDQLSVYSLHSPIHKKLDSRLAIVQIQNEIIDGVKSTIDPEHNTHAIEHTHSLVQPVELWKTVSHSC